MFFFFLSSFLGGMKWDFSTCMLKCLHMCEDAAKGGLGCWSWALAHSPCQGMLQHQQSRSCCGPWGMGSQPCASCSNKGVGLGCFPSDSPPAAAAVVVPDTHIGSPSLRRYFVRQSWWYRPGSAQRVQDRELQNCMYNSTTFGARLSAALQRGASRRRARPISRRDALPRHSRCSRGCRGHIHLSAA